MMTLMGGLERAMNRVLSCHVLWTTASLGVVHPSSLMQDEQGEMEVRPVQMSEELACEANRCLFLMHRLSVLALNYHFRFPLNLQPVWYSSQLILCFIAT